MYDGRHKGHEPRGEKGNQEEITLAFVLFAAITILWQLFQVWNYWLSFALLKYFHFSNYMNFTVLQVTIKMESFYSIPFHHGLSHVTYGIKHLWSSNFVGLFNRMKILSTLRVLADNVPGLGILLSKYMSCFQPLVYHKITFIIMIVSIHFYF